MKGELDDFAAHPVSNPNTDSVPSYPSLGDYPVASVDGLTLLAFLADGGINDPNLQNAFFQRAMELQQAGKSLASGADIGIASPQNSPDPCIGWYDPVNNEGGWATIYVGPNTAGGNPYGIIMYLNDGTTRTGVPGTSAFWKGKSNVTVTVNAGVNESNGNLNFNATA